MDMIVFKRIEVQKYRNFKHVNLENLKDLNILIGPNNCGKTNILELLHSFKELNCETDRNYLCKTCTKLSDNTIQRGINLALSQGDFYLKKSEETMSIAFLLNEEQIEEFVPGIIKRQRGQLQMRRDDVKITPCNQIRDEVVLENLKGRATLVGKHISPFIHEGIIEEIAKFILYCPDQRLQIYKEKNLKDYIRDQKLRSSQKRRWLHFLQTIIDPRIDDERYEDLIIKVNGEDFETAISEQGSGVRSLVCLAADILFSDAKTVLIDEPELGLNPFVKQEFLKFLIKESEKRQIFVATQDPTYVNPILWKNDKVSVYFYSLVEKRFVKIDLKQNLEDPNTFAGYLPHTVSIKDIHLYVEGTSDVYIFQVFLEKFLKLSFPENWFAITNKVGVYHLCGSFWRHLLHTIPKHPYKCVVILDGDKRVEAKEVCNIYDESKVNTSRFLFCNDTKELKENFGGECHPIYCLKENCIEKYLRPEFDCNQPPDDYNKTRDGPKEAELLDVPAEINEIFNVILSSQRS